MKNIHLLSTPNPSRLIHNDANQLCYQSNKSFKNDRKIRKKFNIYITSDEEIKEGDWYINTFVSKREQKPQTHTEKRHLINHQKDYRFKYCQKIILTTDQDLISKTCVHNFVNIINDGFQCTKCKKQVLRSKITVSDTTDGVQTIEDEFIQWFVKNSSCEEVEVKYERIKYLKDNPHPKYMPTEYYYKIIIPKEESKMKVMIVGSGLPKQEKLEEAAENYRNQQGLSIQVSRYKGFLDGAKSDAAKEYWFEIFKQDKKMYSEEDIFKFLDFINNRYYGSFSIDKEDLEEWFEQFKK